MSGGTGAGVRDTAFDRHRSFDRHRRDQYLAFGYVPELGGGDPLALLGAWSRPPRRDERSVSESGLVREGVRALRAAFEQTATQAGAGRPQVVFLSGGLDSRAILGGLLELYSPGELLAATFGLPGEQDFDYAAQVAAAAGVRHEVLETFSVDWTTQALVDSVLAREVPLPHPFGQRYLSYHLHQRIGADHSFWDGLCGDVVTGAHLTGDEHGWSWDEVLDRYVAKHVIVGSERHTSPGFDPRSVLPAAPLCDRSVFSYPDQLFFAVRQARGTSTRQLRGYTVHTPFLSGAWLDYALSVPTRYRDKRQHLYTAVLRAAHPQLFALPATRDATRRRPLPRWARPAREVQRQVLRRAEQVGLRSAAKRSSGANTAIHRGHTEHADVRGVVLGNLEDLARRGLVPGIQPGRITRDVLGGHLHGARMNALLGVELNLKALDRVAARDVDAAA